MFIWGSRSRVPDGTREKELFITPMYICVAQIEVSGGGEEGEEERRGGEGKGGERGDMNVGWRYVWEGMMIYSSIGYLGEGMGV